MAIFEGLKQRLKEMLAPAEDPRIRYADAFQRHRELIAKVARARANLAGSRTALESKLSVARSQLKPLQLPPETDPFAAKLREIVEEELRALESEVVELDQEEQELTALEQRLTLQEQAFAARQSALAARYNAGEARARLQEELSSWDALATVGLVVEKAEQKTEDVRARAAMIDNLTGFTVAPEDGMPARQLANRYSSEASAEESPELRRLLTSGVKTLLELEFEYGQLKAVLSRRRESDPLATAYVPTLADETYRQGLSTLEDALALAMAIRSPGTEKLEGRIQELSREVRDLQGKQTDEALKGIQFREEAISSAQERLQIVQRQRLRIEELIHHCDQCVAALNRTRIELAALKVDSAGTSVDAVIASLRKTIDEARAVQAEMKKLGL